MPPKGVEKKARKQATKTPSTQKGKVKKDWTREQADEAQQILLDTSNGFIKRDGKNKGKPVGSTDPSTKRPYTLRGIAKKTTIPFRTIANWRENLIVEDYKVSVTIGVGTPLLSACLRKASEKEILGFCFF